MKLLHRARERDGRGATSLAQSRSTFCSDASRRQLFTAESRSGRARRTERLIAVCSAYADIPLATQLFVRDQRAIFTLPRWRD